MLGEIVNLVQKYGFAALIAIILLGAFLGWVPSTVSSTLSRLDQQHEKMIGIQERQQQLSEQQAKLWRGMCYKLLNDQDCLK